MKKIIFVIALVLGSFSFAQEATPTENTNPKNELKINAISTLAGFPEFTYERLLNEESAFGLSLGFAADKEMETKFTLVPYYRFYFGKKYAAGFYVEGFGMLNSISIPDYQYYNYSYDPVNSYYYSTQKGEKYTDFALGFGIGSKWITKKGVIFELNAGFGRNLLNADKNDFYGHEFVGRGGLSVGYRF
jgi:hypothetical protein